MQKELEGRVKVVDCMVDRVCTGRTIGPEGVAITAEPWNGSIVCLEPGLPREAVPFSPEIAGEPAAIGSSPLIYHSSLPFLTTIPPTTIPHDHPS